MMYLCLEKEPVTVRVAGDAYLGYDLAQIGETHHIIPIVLYNISFLIIKLKTNETHHLHHQHHQHHQNKLL